MDHDIRPLYFDVAGAEMTKADFLKAYPARVPIARTRVMGALVCTEFVGINHRAAAGSPLIYETVVVVQVEGFGVVRSFAWSGGFKRSKWWHALACVNACVGGGLWWRYCAYREGL